MYIATLEATSQNSGRRRECEKDYVTALIALLLRRSTIPFYLGCCGIVRVSLMPCFWREDVTCLLAISLALYVRSAFVCLHLWFATNIGV